MTSYECSKCKKEFNKKSNYDCHIMRKFSCVKNSELDNKCEYCDKIYSTKYNLKIHMNTCKQNNDDDDNKLQIEELKKMFEKKFEEQQKKIDELSHISNINETNNNITVTENSHNNNITNNINIYNAGKEDLSHLSKEDIIKICTSGTYYPIVAAEVIHCNKKYPQFQNFLISNLRASTGQVKVNDDWVTQSQDDILTNLMRVDKKHVSNLIKNLEVDDKLKIKLESTQDEIDTGESKEHQKSKIRNKLYNASRMINKNKKQEEKVLAN
jgi:hypothetical protein